MLPLTYVIDAMQRVTTASGFNHQIGVDLVVVCGAAVVALVLGAVTLRRRTA